jgi:lipid-A-disaccharide synthase-like uncharacterized protein
MTTSSSVERRNDDGNVGPTLWTVALTGVVLTLCSPLVFGVSGVVSTGIGGAMAVANLWAISRLVRGLVGGGRGLTWGPLGAIKLMALFLVLYILLRHDLAKVLPLAFGYLALPIGVVLSQLRTNAPARGEN